MAKISYIGRSIMPQEFMHIREELGLPAVGFPVAARALRDDLFNVIVLLDGETPVACGRLIGDGATRAGRSRRAAGAAARVGTKVMEILSGS
jgi:hypothetical protein